MLKSRLISAIAGALLLSGVRALPEPRAQPRCKCLAGQSCWPDQRSWAQLNQKLSRPVFAVLPPAQPCHDPHFDQAACASVQANYHDAMWRTQQPGAAESNNWEWSKDLTQTCYFNASRTDACAQGRVPTIAVNATTVKDIQEAVKFAARNNLKLKVKNTGHDFLGRGLGQGTFMIWTHHFKYIDYTENFKPAKGKPTGFPAITLGPGVQWADAYKFADTKGKSIAGGVGADGSVGAAGGWPLGGGHNILSPSLGLGVDNILEITVVTAEGDHITANAYQNTDLFWALRGGGGPSFGIATSITYRLHPKDPLYAYFFEASFEKPETFSAVMDSWHKALPAISDAGWSGYYPFGPQFFALQYLLPNGDAKKANATLGPWLAEVAKIPGVQVGVSAAIKYDGFYQWFDANILHPDHVIGFNYTGGPGMGNGYSPASWLLPRSLFENNSSIPQVSAAFSGFFEGIGQVVGGGAVAKVPKDSMAAHPAWRTCLVDVAVSGFWTDGTPLTEIDRQQHGISALMAPVRALTPGDSYAQYLNEPDLYVPNWQQANWGPHYARLQQIKRKVDPSGMFIVVQGVGSEAWDENQICRL